MYYANEFIYYVVTNGKRTFVQYTGTTLYKTREQAIKNAQKEWEAIAADNEILTNKRTKGMYLWKE